MSNTKLEPNKKYLLFLSSISYLGEMPIQFGAEVTFLREDFGFWFDYKGQEAMVANDHWFVEITKEAKQKVKRYNQITKEIEKLIKEQNNLFNT